jgi:hypothetical protein
MITRRCCRYGPSVTGTWAAPEFEERRRLLNERLLLSGFEVAEDRRKGHRPRSGAG